MAQLQYLQWMPIIAAAVAAWLFGAVYYGLLGKAWIAAQGKTMEGLKAQNAGKSAAAKAAPFIASFVAEIVMGGALYGILIHMGLLTLHAGVVAGVLCWLGFVLTTIAINNAYAGRSLTLTAIDSLHWLGVLAIIGAVVGGIGP